MPKLLFWNLGKQSRKELLRSLARDLFVDAIVLVEAGDALPITLADLREHLSPAFSTPAAVAGRIQVFSRDQNLDLSEVFSSDRLSIRRLSISGIELLLCIVHLVDKGNWEQLQQYAEVQLVAELIRVQEESAGHRRTIAIGDFNLNPFDPAMNLATGFNAMMTQECVARGSRKVQGREYPYFYNPMWGLFGDSTPGPPGTYFHSNSAKGFFGWNMLDQVLVRPDALPHYGSVEIVDSVATFHLKSKSQRPAKGAASDHFPILLRLK